MSQTFLKTSYKMEQYFSQPEIKIRQPTSMT